MRKIVGGGMILAGVMTVLSLGLGAFMVYNPRFFHARIYREGFLDLWQNTAMVGISSVIALVLCYQIRQWIMRRDVRIYEIQPHHSIIATPSA